jgi:hypothetical protein
MDKITQESVEAVVRIIKRSQRVWTVGYFNKIKRSWEIQQGQSILDMLRYDIPSVYALTTNGWVLIKNPVDLENETPGRRPYPDPPIDSLVRLTRTGNEINTSFPQQERTHKGGW